MAAVARCNSSGGFPGQFRGSCRAPAEEAGNLFLVDGFLCSLFSAHLRRRCVRCGRCCSTCCSFTSFSFFSFVVPKQGKLSPPFARILSLLLATYANL